ncbi:hypothetical protein DFJ58DRAFT_730323 [Suillus subalutaceus]|uniref:uncharacterized protein n=1 Tax=Suillus subalutaceus TaxID=48586 RepID=UPI001B865ECE|nr:uncharacterized protein DFJ58DRAFT_730323 [Suillus subalutaceus]KAG1846996.1 hypothetical protein DFJ58DRAFT_730323 [Suillus subalutaceus]
MPLLHRALPLKQIHEDDPDSVTEPESELDVPPKPVQPVQPVQPLENDPDSITEPESSDIDIPSSTLTATLKRKSFFATPSPPPPNSIYWKHVSREEDARWYDRTGTDDSFRAVRQMKQELEQL